MPALELLFTCQPSIDVDILVVSVFVNVFFATDQLSSDVSLCASG